MDLFLHFPVSVHAGTTSSLPFRLGRSMCEHLNACLGSINTGNFMTNWISYQLQNEGLVLLNYVLQSFHYAFRNTKSLCWITYCKVFTTHLVIRKVLNATSLLLNFMASAALLTEKYFLVPFGQGEWYLEQVKTWQWGVTTVRRGSRLSVVHLLGRHSSQYAVKLVRSLCSPCRHVVEWRCRSMRS